MIGRWIGFAAEKPAQPGAPAGRPLDAAAVPLLEEGIRQLERMLLDEQAALKQRLARVGERLDRAQAQRQLKRQPSSSKRQLRAERSSEAAAELEAVRTRVRDLEAEAERAKDRARADAQVIRGLQERLEMVEESTSFRLGHALVLGAKSPRRLAGLPAAAWRLWREPGRTAGADARR